MSGYWYLATVYSKHPSGVHAAWLQACRWAALDRIPALAALRGAARIEAEAAIERAVAEAIEDAIAALPATPSTP